MLHLNIIVIVVWKISFHFIKVPEGDAAGDPDEPPGRGRRIQSAASAPEAAADIVQLPD